MATCSLPARRGASGKPPRARRTSTRSTSRNAIAFAETHLRASVQIFRNNCKVAEGLLDPVTDFACL